MIDKNVTLTELLSVLKRCLLNFKGKKISLNQKKISDTVSQVTHLSKELKKCLEITNPYPYEFYEAATELVSVISLLRIDVDWEPFLHEMKVWELINEWVNALAEVIYRQPVTLSLPQADLIGMSINWNTVSVLKLKEWLETMEDAANKTGLEADLALKQSEQFSRNMQKLAQDKHQIDRLIQETNDVILAHCIKNAAAAIAIDRMTTVRQYFLYKVSLL